jgi:hypothetical protein
VRELFHKKFSPRTPFQKLLIKLREYAVLFNSEKILIATEDKYFFKNVLKRRSFCVILNMQF